MFLLIKGGYCTWLPLERLETAKSCFVSIPEFLIFSIFVKKEKKKPLGYYRFKHNKIIFFLRGTEEPLHTLMDLVF